MRLMIAGALVIPIWTAAASLPSLCLSDPPITLDAGSSAVSVVVNGNMIGRACKATLSFADPEFLPLSYYFEAMSCPGQYLISFLTPAGAPNGDASITWQCAGLQPLCSYARISGGSSDPTMDLDNPGIVGCVIEALQTSTTLVTITRSSTTLVEAEEMVFTTTSTALTTNTSIATSTDTQVKQAASTDKSDLTASALMSIANKSTEVMSMSSVIDQGSLATRTNTVLPQATSDMPISSTILASLNAKTEGPNTVTLTSAPGTETTTLAALTNQDGGLFQNTSDGTKLSSSVLPVAFGIVSTLTVISSVSTCGMDF